MIVDEPDASQAIETEWILLQRRGYGGGGNRTLNQILLRLKKSCALFKQAHARQCRRIALQAQIYCSIQSLAKSSIYVLKLDNESTKCMLTIPRYSRERLLFQSFISLSRGSIVLTPGRGAVLVLLTSVAPTRQ